MLVEADWVGVADVADVVRPILCAMAAGGVFVRRGNGVAWRSTVLRRHARRS
jgi:hypothetical protein